MGELSNTKEAEELHLLLLSTKGRHKGSKSRLYRHGSLPRAEFFFCTGRSAMCAERHKSPSRGFREMSLTTKTGSTSQNTNTKNTNQNNQQARTKGQTQSPYESK